tara:strand:+ start:117 stop:353 length:237 start_codon:yes stop_codon:yes gene_type:complete
MLDKQSMYKLIFFTSSFSLFIMPAYAYIDPGIGSLILQGIIFAFATIVTGFVFAKEKIKNFFFKFFKKNKNNKNNNIK